MLQEGVGSIVSRTTTFSAGFALFRKPNCTRWSTPAGRAHTPRASQHILWQHEAKGRVCSPCCCGHRPCLAHQAVTRSYQSQ